MNFEVDEILASTFSRNLTGLQGMLRKGKIYAASVGIDINELVDAKVSEDMHSLEWQVQKATGTVIDTLNKFGGEFHPPETERRETYLSLLHRVELTLKILADFSSGNLQVTDGEIIVLKVGTEVLNLDVSTYLMAYAFPNFYFHVAAAYNILRGVGVKIDKMDFLGCV